MSKKQRNKNVMTPRPLKAKARAAQAIRWIIKASGNRGDHRLEMRLAKEMIAIIKGDSDVLKRKDEAHRLALANRLVYLIAICFSMCLELTSAFRRANALVRM